jgi:hypothetical protein
LVKSHPRKRQEVDDFVDASEKFVAAEMSLQNRLHHPVLEVTRNRHLQTTFRNDNSDDVPNDVSKRHFKTTFQNDVPNDVSKRRFKTTNKNARAHRNPLDLFLVTGRGLGLVFEVDGPPLDDLLGLATQLKSVVRDFRRSLKKAAPPLAVTFGNTTLSLGLNWRYEL